MGSCVVQMPSLDLKRTWTLSSALRRVCSSRHCLCRGRTFDGARSLGGTGAREALAPQKIESVRRVFPGLPVSSHQAKCGLQCGDEEMHERPTGPGGR